MILSSNLEVTINRLNAFFPIRTKDERKDFNWNSILGIVVGEFYKKKLLVRDILSFELLCEEEFKQRLDDPNFWDTLKRMYFDPDNYGLFEVGPEFLLFRSSEIEDNKHNQRVADMFVNLLGADTHLTLSSMRRNFIENVIFEVLNKKALKPEASYKPRVIKEEPFLPFLTESFKKDLAFLGTKPRYLQENFDSFLRLYAFIYTSQLAHNLANCDDSDPAPRENYLILDTEKAGAERKYLKDFGHKQLYKNVEKIFPYLSMSEMLQGGNETIVPLWKLIRFLGADNNTRDRLDSFAITFAEERKLTRKSTLASANSNAALHKLLGLSVDQFKTGNKDKDNINTDFAKATLKHLCADFIQIRGAAGSVLVINQDYLLLLTNIVIGEEESLRLNELVKGFNQRGIFFDKQSQAEIVRFYERIGNVERMSDSGDAVYVRKTI